MAEQYESTSTCLPLRNAGGYHMQNLPGQTRREHLVQYRQGSLVSLLNAILHKTDKKYRGEILDACSGHGHSALGILEMMKEHAGSGIGPRFGEPE